MTRRPLAGLTFLLLALATTARAEECTEITNVPYLVSAPGTYCLKVPLAFSSTLGYAIRIDADDVVLDLNRHVLDGSGAGPGTHAIGIYAPYPSNVTVRNGTIRGFHTGVLIGNSASEGHVLEALHADHNTSVGLAVSGKGTIVRNNRVSATGGWSTPSATIIGIFARGAGLHVVDNEVIETVEGVSGTQPAYGIRVLYAAGAVLERNVVSNPSFGPIASHGLQVVASANVTVAGNRVAHMRNGITFAGGGTGLYIDNTVVGATTPFTGGTAAGTTNFSF